MLVFQHNELRGRAGSADLAALVLAPVGTHLLLLLTWWCVFRWVNQPLDSVPFVVAAWLLSLGLTAWSLKQRARERVPRLDMLLRVPAALYFFVLLALTAAHKADLIAYALAFAPPYLSLTRLAPRGKSPAEPAGTPAG
jgi:hypothetical protein